MLKLAAAVLLSALLAGTAAAAQAPDPVESRAAALIELQAAIDDELVAIGLMRKDPPRRDTARLRLAKTLQRLAAVRDFLSRTPGAGAAEQAVGSAWTGDVRARDAIARLEDRRAVVLLQENVDRKRSALAAVRTAKPPAAVAQCSDGKDNDGDGIVDWALEPGCTSARDAREGTKLGCAVESRLAAGRLVVSGSCSGAFSELEVTLLDGVRLNGRFDIAHAPSCSPPKPDAVRCSTKDGAQNPGHLIDLRLTTTSKSARQRVALRLFDRRKRVALRLVVPGS
jgi:hypothetical protein